MIDFKINDVITFNTCWIMKYHKNTLLGRSTKIYTRCIKSSTTIKYLENKAFLRKMFQTEIVGFKNMYLMITSV